MWYSISMKRCKTCIWWRNGACVVVGTLEAVSNPNTLFCIDAGADDDQGSWELLLTGPDFGCIHHQGKDNDSKA